MTKFSKNTVAAFVKVTVVTDEALFGFVYRSFKTVTCWLPAQSFAMDP